MFRDKIVSQLRISPKGEKWQSNMSVVRYDWNAMTTCTDIETIDASYIFCKIIENWTLLLFAIINARLVIHTYFDNVFSQQQCCINTKYSNVCVKKQSQSWILRSNSHFEPETFLWIMSFASDAPFAMKEYANSSSDFRTNCMASEHSTVCGGNNSSAIYSKVHHLDSDI